MNNSLLKKKVGVTMLVNRPVYLYDNHYNIILNTMKYEY